jgi:DNA (cytosine-5)-methyltransferase 1
MTTYTEIQETILTENALLTREEQAYLTHYLFTQNTKAAKSFDKGKFFLPYQKLPKSFVFDIPFPPPKKAIFSFIDLFSGIGGFRITLQELNGKCVFSSEWDKYAQDTYYANFGEMPFGDIGAFTNPEKVSDSDLDVKIPDHEILCAGFPCQAFSIAGYRKGFNDTRGTLFFDVARILNVKRPLAFILENVKGLVNHKGGKTLATMLSVLKNDLKYIVPEPQILNAKNFGVPQNRERVFIVGFRKNEHAAQFKFPSKAGLVKSFKDVMEKEVVSVKYYLSEQYLKTLRKHKARHAAKGNGFGYEIIDINGIANAIVVGGMGRERNLVVDKRLRNFNPVTHIKGKINREGIRRMTPREWARLQGFDDRFEIAVADAQAYRQFGNSVPVPMVKAVAKNVIAAMKGGK